MCSADVSRVFPLDYVPPVLDQYTASVMINGQPVIIGLHDTMGEPAYDRLRPLCYPDTDVFVLCFSLTDGPSFENIVSKVAHPSVIGGSPLELVHVFSR